MSEASVTEQSGFLDGQYYTAAFLYEFVALLVGNGVYENELATIATSETMEITHGAGHAWINGVLYKNSIPFSMPVATADGKLSRYDSLMLRLDLSVNEAYAIIVQGVFATEPVAPQPTRDAETWELKLCDIYIPAGCTKITQAQIFDTRLDSAVCGVPAFPVQHLDMTTFYQQIVTDLHNFREQHQANFSAWAEDTKNINLQELAELVGKVRDTSNESTSAILGLLSQLNELVEGDTIGHLILKIEAVRQQADAKISAIKTETEAALSEMKTETDNALQEGLLAAETAISNISDEVHIFSCTLLADGWATRPAADGGGYAQTVDCPGLLAAYDLEAPQTPATGVKATDAALKEGLDVLCEAGNAGETLDGQLKWICYNTPPTVDLPLRLRRAAVDSTPEAGGGEQEPENPAGPDGEEV